MNISTKRKRGCRTLERKRERERERERDDDSDIYYVKRVYKDAYEA